MLVSKTKVSQKIDDSKPINLMSNAVLSFLFKRKSNDIKICWFDLSSYTNGELIGNVVNDF